MKSPEGKKDQYHPSLPILIDYLEETLFYWLNKDSCPESLARSIWNWIKKGMAVGPYSFRYGS